MYHVQGFNDVFVACGLLTVIFLFPALLAVCGFIYRINGA